MSEAELSGGSQSAAESTTELIAVARVVKTRGLRGEVVADLLTDFPERFDGLEGLIAVRANGNRESLRIEEHWLQGQRLVLKFAGFDSIDSAQELVGCELTVPEVERVKLPENQFYTWELIGCRVETISGEDLGTVRDVTATGSVEILMIDGPERELLIPMAEDICVDIDVARKLIRVDPPEGLLEF